jgi:hypothetical protein
MRAAAAIVGLTLAGLAPAFGSGGLWCSAEDDAVTFSIQAGLSRGSGALFNFRGEVSVLLPGAPADLRDLKLVGSDLIQHWLDARELKLLVTHEPNEVLSASLTLLVQTRRTDADDEGSYNGDYVLTISFMKSAQDSEATILATRGSASCSAE